MLAPGLTVVALTVSTGAVPATDCTVTAGLVAVRVYPLFGYSLNSYGPVMDGAVTVHVLVVTPVPTYTNVVKLVSGEPTGANASQSDAPPAPFFNVTVTLAPGATVV